MRRKRWIRPIIIGFLTMYLALMLLATYMMKNKFTEEFQQNMVNALSNVQQMMSDKEEMEMDNEAYTDAYRRSYSEYLLSGILTSGSAGAYQMMSGAVYHEDGTLLAKTDNLIGGMTALDAHNGKSQYWYFSLDVLTKEEREELAGYYCANLSDCVLGEAYTTPDKYRILMKISKDGAKLYGIIVQKITWTNKADGIDGVYVDPLTNSSYSWDTGYGDYRETGSEVVWEWNAAGTEALSLSEYEIHHVNVIFPYLNFSKEYWEKWSQSIYLRDFPLSKGVICYSDAVDAMNKKILEMARDEYSFGTRESMQTMVLKGDPYGEYDYYYLEIRSECHPWLAAMAYLIYIYLTGLVLMLVCMARIVHVTNKLYEQRAVLEETRRDFTNAMAHELKTPLGIIRGFAENLQERPAEEKRDYYLDQIIGQTEEMDQLVVKMIEVSRLDSEKLVLQREQISLMDLCKEQMERLKPVVLQKNLNIQYLEEDACLVAGDRDYLARAVWNLLDNAAAYNVPDGTIRIYCKKDMCIIENTGFPVEEETLQHVFDLFYSSDKSRGGKGHHLGMGLYLAKKIFDRHQIDIIFENRKDGVCVTLKKNKRK